MSVGFCRYSKGAADEWTSTQELIVTKGVFTVCSDDGDKTAKASEVIFLTKAGRSSTGARWTIPGSSMWSIRIGWMQPASRSVPTYRMRSTRHEIVAI